MALSVAMVVSGFYVEGHLGGLFKLPEMWLTYIKGYRAHKFIVQPCLFMYKICH